VALLSGKTVKNSFSIAREALKLSPYVSDRVLEGDKFILLPDYSTVTADLQLDEASLAENHHSKAIFPSRPVVDWPMPGKHCTMGPNLIDVKTFLASNRLPSPPADFEGREVVMHNVIRHILDRRLVSLVGEDGVGKSAVAAAICKYLSDREMFPDSIVYFRAKGHKDYRSFLSGLLSALLHSGCNSLATRLQALLSTQSNGPGALNLVYPEEEVIFSCLESLRMLLVLDNLDELVAEYGESHTDFRIFLGRLFEQCPYVKVLVVSTDTLAMHNINVGFGIVEYSILLGPLTLISTLRLFARLAPSLSSASARKDFIAALQPARQMHVSVNSREINKTALQILSMLGDGHPAKIVHMACESTQETVEHLRAHGMDIISNSAAHTSSGASVSGYSVSMASFTSTPPLAGLSGATPNMSTTTSYNAFDSSNL
jgi:ABC-type dipeptide/oligopeptide/nickel transport system ATPase component